MRRQIFLVGLGGWDTHNNQTPGLDALATQLNTALASFQQDLQAMGVENDVTTFTVSDSDLLDVFPELDRFESGWQNQYGLFS